MLPETGQFALCLALCIAVVQVIFPLAGAQTGRVGWMALARPTAAGQFVFVALAFACLTSAFVTNDFSVLYVANNSNTQLPLFYRIAAVWGAHEGSLLLWLLILSTWTAAVAAFSSAMPESFRARVIAVMGFISIGFLLFILLTSNPFERLAVAPPDGNDLNPLLQDPAMAIHPPMLYAGYVGFSVAFSFAVAAMLAGRLDRDWARWTRPWTTAAWCFLTIGIALGSWWAYYELGWGGWWFWDPVENASFMPWLVGTALIHSLAVTEKRGLFRSSTLLLAIGAFSLSLLGTFLVRSGVLVSVHAFASDPARGLFILIFLAVVIGAALALYAWRARELDTPLGFAAFSRETFLLINTVLLVIAAGLILLGTLYPLILDALGRGKISVGPPYFDLVFIVPMLPLLACVVVGMHTAWRHAEASVVMRRLRVPALLALILGVSVPLLLWGPISAAAFIGTIAGFWVIAGALADPVARLFGRGPRPTLAATGMQIAHAGLGFCTIGIVVVSSFTVEIDQVIAPGETVSIAGYELRMSNIEEFEGPNYSGVRGYFDLMRDGTLVTVLAPEKRVYRVQKSPMTEAAIDGNWVRDVFVALGEPVGQGAWSTRIQYKPMIRFIWFGAFVMFAGGILALSDRRYRRRRASQPQVVDGPAAAAASRPGP